MLKDAYRTGTKEEWSIGIYMYVDSTVGGQS